MIGDDGLTVSKGDGYGHEQGDGYGRHAFIFGAGQSPHREALGIIGYMIRFDRGGGKGKHRGYRYGILGPHVQGRINSYTGNHMRPEVVKELVGRSV